MKKVTLLVGAFLCAISSFAQGEYPINWDKDANLSFTRSERQTSSVSITVDGEQQTIDVMSKSGVVYRDFSDQTFTVEAGAEIVPSMAYKGEWMHGYVYLDTNNNKLFDVESYESQEDELVAFSFYSPTDASNGVNGIGESKSNNCNVNPMNAFKAPEKPGQYRMRYIVDWNCIDPAGQYGSKYTSNFINANGGVIVDVTLVVEGGAPVVPEYNTTTKFFTAPELRAEADATGKALIGIAGVTTTANKYINGKAYNGVLASEEGTLAGLRAPQEDEVLEVIATEGGYLLRQADAAEGEGYLKCAAGQNFTTSVAADANVWSILGPGEDGYGDVTGWDDLYSDIDKSYNENMVRFISNGQYLNGQNRDGIGGLRGGKGAWSFNYVYNANYTEGGEVVDPVDPEPPIVEPTVPTMSITAVFPNGNEHVVYAYEGKLTASATVPEGAISNFEIVSNEGDVYVLKAGDQYLHWTSGDNKDKSADLDGLNEEFDESINYLTIKLGDESGLQSTTWDKAPIASLYEVIGNGTNGQPFDFTLRENDDAWIAGDSGMKFFDTNWDGNGCRTSYFRVEMSETPVDPVDPEPPVVEGPQAAFTLTNLSSTADEYSFPIEVPAEFAAPVLEAKATTTVIEFVKTVGTKAAFVASTDGGNNFYANITLADNRIGFDYMMDNGAEGWFTKTQAPYTNLNTTVRVALTQDEESGLLNWYDAETGQQINSTNVGTNAAWGSRSFGTNGYNHLYVGGYLDAAGHAQYVFPGTIASVRVYPQLLTTEEMTSLTWEGLEDSFKYIPDYNYAKEIAPVLAEANALLEGHDNVWVTTFSDELITRNNQFSSPNTDPSEGSTNNLLDGSANTFWHSNWHNGNQPAHSHYLQVALDEPIDGDVLLTFVRRNAANDQVTRLDVETSMDGVNFAHAAYIDMPNSGAGKTELKEFALEQKALYLRFWADATTSNRGYWHCGDFQLQTFHTDLNVDAPDYAYPTAVKDLQDAIAATPAANGTKEDVEALAAAVEAYKAALAGYPEFTEWNGDIAINAGEVKSIDDLLNVDLCFSRAAEIERGYSVLGAIFDQTGDAYALVLDGFCGDVDYKTVKTQEFVGKVASVEFKKISEFAGEIQAQAKAAAAKIGAFQPEAGHAYVLIASKSFLVDGEKFNEFKKFNYELSTGIVTGVETIVVSANNVMFDLQGRRTNSTNGLRIQNGRVVR